MPLAECFVSVIARVYDNPVVMCDYVREIIALLSARYSNYELVIVDDHASLETVVQLDELLGAHRCVRVLRLSRPVGEEIAIAAGLDTAIGDFVVVMHPDRDPIDVVPEMVRLARSGNHVVTGVCDRHIGAGFWVRLLAPAFFWLCNRWLKLGLRADATNFRVFSRQAVNAITRTKENHRFLRMASSWIGHSATTFRYDQITRAGSPQSRSLLDSINLAVSLVVSGSLRPLRLVSYLGLLVCFVNLLYVGYIVAVNLIKDRVAEGWTTLSLQATCMFLFVFLILTVICEYVGRVLEESRDRPVYHILEEKISSVAVADEERPNVLEQTTLAWPGEEQLSHGEQPN